jgi:hypothetical protein
MISREAVDPPVAEPEESLSDVALSKVYETS